MKITEFKHLCNISLDYNRECALLGITKNGHIFVEEFDDENAIRHHIDPTCKILQSGEIDLPDDLEMPHLPTDHPLNYSGGRYRGMREADRVGEWVQPLTIMEKMPLMPHLNITVPPMLLLGIAESRVTSEAHLINDISFVCRRVRIAYALQQQQVDNDGLPYDYDTLVLHVAHIYDDASETTPPLAETVQGLGGVKLQRPLDCIVQDNRLILADGGDVNSSSRILIFDIVMSD